MTVKEVVDRADRLRPNDVSAEEKLRWVADIESRIYEDIFLTHEHEGLTFTDIAAIKSDTGAELFLKTPYESIYILFLCSLIDFCHGEYDRFLNDTAVFEEEYGKFCRYWNAKHISVGRTRITG